MEINVHSDRSKWDRAVELAYAAAEFEMRLADGGHIKVDEIRERLVEPYVNRWDGTGTYYPTRHNLYSGEIYSALRPESRIEEGDEILAVIPKEKFLKTLKDIVGQLIGPETGIENPYPYDPARIKD